MPTGDKYFEHFQRVVKFQRSVISADQANRFLDTIQEIWHIADRFQIPMPLTSFIFLGPQSVGKCSIVERIIGCKITEVRNGIATLRPLVVTLLRKPQSSIQVYEQQEDGTNSAPQTLASKEEIPSWVTDKNALQNANGQPTVSRRPIYLTL